MIEREYLVGYNDALEIISEYITQASKRYQNNTLAVLNDVIAKLHNELAEKRIALRDLDEFNEIVNNEEIKEIIKAIANDEKVEEIVKAMDDLVNTATKPIILKVEKIEKGGRLL